MFVLSYFVKVSLLRVPEPVDGCYVVRHAHHEWAKFGKSHKVGVICLHKYMRGINIF